MEAEAAACARAQGETFMRRYRRLPTLLFIVLLVSLFIVPAAFAQDSLTDLAAPFAPIMAASLTIERSLQLMRNLLNPDPDRGPLARGTKALRYFVTIGGTLMGIVMTALSNLRLLATTGILANQIVDIVLTGIVVGMGTEFVHEVIGIVIEGKNALRSTSEQKDAQVASGEGALG
jgi:hypothetical protein